MNVLLTCAGRRNYLVTYFRSALAGRGEVIAADASATAPALAEADRAEVVPPLEAPAYIEAIAGLCAKRRVGLWISLSDLELPIMARHRAPFEAIGTKVVVSAPAVVDRCFDKVATDRFVKELGYASPPTFTGMEAARRAIDSGELALPVVVKPRWGTASLGVEICESLGELELAWRLGHARLSRSMLGAASAADPARALLIQAKLGGDEYGLDIVNDLDGRHVTTWVKRKLAMRGGETDKAETIDDTRLRSLGWRLGEALAHVGNLDCDVFVDGGVATVLELNPRFGGGYPFSHAAGADLPSALIAWARGERPDPGWLWAKPGVIGAKCERLVVTRSASR